MIGTEQGQYLSQCLHEQASPSGAVLLAGAEVVLHACGRRARCSASAPRAPSTGNNHPTLAALAARTHSKQTQTLSHLRASKDFRHVKHLILRGENCL